MANINFGRVILGGLVAGVVIDVFENVVNGAILGQRWSEALTSLNRPMTFSPKQLIVLNLLGFFVGILTVWLYAAIRTRFGPGPKTAIIAGFAVWLFFDAAANVFPVVMHLFPVGLVITGLCVALVEQILAALAGAKVYKEEPALQVRTAKA